MKVTKGQRTKENIVVEALTLFNKKGVQNTSFQEIATKVGITQAALYKYFDNSDDLLTEGILLGSARGRQFFLTKTQEGVSAQEAFIEHIKANIEWCHLGKPFNFAFLALHFYKNQIPSIKKIHDDVSKARTQRFQKFIENGNQDGSWKVKNASMLALTIHNYLLGEMMEAINNPKKESFEVRHTRIGKTILSLLGAVLPG